MRQCKKDIREERGKKTKREKAEDRVMENNRQKGGGEACQEIGKEMKEAEKKELWDKKGKGK